MTFQQRTDIPATTLFIQDLNLLVIDSTFEDLAAAAQGSLILDGVNATFLNVTFMRNEQSGAGERQQRRKLS